MASVSLAQLFLGPCPQEGKVCQGYQFESHQPLGGVCVTDKGFQGPSKTSTIISTVRVPGAGREEEESQLIDGSGPVEFAVESSHLN
jgi:hypothetical protein